MDRRKESKETHEEAAELVVRLEVVKILYDALSKAGVGTNAIENEGMKIARDKLNGPTGHRFVISERVVDRQAVTENELKMEGSPSQCWREPGLIRKLLSIRRKIVKSQLKKAKTNLACEMKYVTATRSRKEVSDCWSQVRIMRKKIWDEEHPKHVKKVEHLKKKASNCSKHKTCKELDLLWAGRMRKFRNGSLEQCQKPEEDHCPVPLSETKVDVENDADTVGESLIELIVEKMKSTEVARVKDGVVPDDEDDPDTLDYGECTEVTGMAHPVVDCVTEDEEDGGDVVAVVDGTKDDKKHATEDDDQGGAAKARSLLKEDHVTRDQSPEFKTFSKDQAWSYDQPKVQAWPLLRRTHQAVLLRYDHAWSLENVLISGLWTDKGWTETRGDCQEIAGLQQEDDDQTQPAEKWRRRRC